ncbi:MAG: DMT family transporter [Anaerolineaceae bacterium]
MIGILFAFSAALFWGSGDFSGGVATRRSNPFQVLTLSALSGVLVLAIAALLWGEAFPNWSGVLWAMAAGLGGAIGIASLYRGLSIGNSAAVAPTSAVIGAALPVGFTLITRGAPALLQIIGFVLAFAGIWLVSRSSPSNSKESQQGFLLGCLAGLGFGAYFIFIAQVGDAKVITPLIIARGVMAVTAIILLKVNHLSFPPVRSNPFALLAGMLDASGNMFFLLAKEFTRLDTAVIIGSLYPAVTVIFTSLVFKEKISLWQKIGVVVCLIAILMITL